MYRKGIGAILIDEDKNLYSFQRADYDTNWQGPEGGIDNNETTENALYRELYEELGIKNKDYTILNSTKDFLRYTFDDAVKNKRLNFIGQDKKFFLIQVKNGFKNFKFDVEPNGIEFKDFRITNAETLLNSVPHFKKETYKQVLEEFKLI